MVKWDQDNKFKLLLVIIEHVNPGSLPWEDIASTMGPDVTSEAARNAYKIIKKGFKPAPSTSASTPSSTKTPKPTSKAKTRAPATKSNPRKRKANEASLNDDDDYDESTLHAPKSSKVKTEDADNGIRAEVFKTEVQGEEEVDLENDALYSAA